MSTTSSDLQSQFYERQRQRDLDRYKDSGLDMGFFDSQEYQNFASGPQMGTQDMYNSRYFGQMGSGSLGRQQEQAYEAYLKRTGQDSLIQPYQEANILNGLKPGGQPLENDPMPYAELQQPYMSQPVSYTQQPLAIDIGQVEQGLFNSVYKMSNEERQSWAESRNLQRDVKTPREQELINAVLSGTYDAMQFRPTDDAGNPLGSQMYGVNFALPSNYVPTGNEATAMATTNTDVSNLPAYTPPAEEGQQQIISTQPQNLDEINVVDYQGLQAMQPVLQPSTQLGTQIQELEVQPDEIQTAPTLGEAPAVTTPQVRPAETVIAPEMPETSLAEYQTTTVVDRPDVTATSAASSIESVSQAADALQAAQQDLGTIDPRATVQGQLALLQKQFEDGQTPIWAQGAMKQATALMAQRGLSSSTMAAEAITNALMQSTLPIAQQDSAFYQTVTMQNLANEQQVELEKFNARVSSIFNDQAAENTARNINAATENEMAQFYANLAQSVALSNTEAFNALEQFNATTKNQADQFAAELGLTADTFNADAINDRAEFDAELIANISQFNASMKNNREQFDVQNQIAIDASNIQWRRDVNTANTSATNAAIQFDIQNMLDMQNTALNNLWNHYDTLLNMTWKSEENAIDRTTQIAIATMQEEMRKQIAEADSDGNMLAGIFKAGATILGSDTGKSILTSLKII